MEGFTHRERTQQRYSAQAVHENHLRSLQMTGHFKYTLRLQSHQYREEKTKGPKPWARSLGEKPMRRLKRSKE